MDCEQYQRNISKLVDGELPRDASDALLRHMSACPECRATLRAITALNDHLKAEAPLTDSVLVSRVKAKISGQDSQTPDRRLLPLWSRASLLVAIVVLALGLGNLAGRSIGEILAGAQREATLEMIAGDSAQSLADVVTDLSPEEK